jgi:UDP-hydrolysing UDP-N-acetyl-D-glucosamine 2-epimerase
VFAVSLRRIAVVTGTRAEWGLLRPVCEAIRAEHGLTLQVVAGGAHLLAPARTIDEVRAFAPGLVEFAMQVPGDTGRMADARALGRGTAALADIFAAIAPEIVVVLGDRIEAFAAASAAAVGGIRVAHIHGGDRAEGVADESMRHAITKLAHLHFPASAASAQRILAMGEQPQTVHLAGSPSIDGLETIAPLDDAAYAELDAPEYVVLMHPCGRSDAVEHADAAAMLDAARAHGRVLALMPNSDPGRAGIARAIAERCTQVRVAEHLPRARFVALLKRPEIRALVGNSSAGIIEAAALGVRVIDVGGRQRGRERAANVVHCADAEPHALSDAFAAAARPVALLDRPLRHPYGSGGAGFRIARVLAQCDLAQHPLQKLNSY